MRYFFAVCVSIILVILFFFSLLSVSEYGVVALILSGASGYCLYKLYMMMYDRYKARGASSGCSSGNCSPVKPPSMFECILFGDSTEDDQDDRN